MISTGTRSLKADLVTEDAEPQEGSPQALLRVALLEAAKPLPPGVSSPGVCAMSSAQVLLHTQSAQVFQSGVVTRLLL